MWKTWITAVFGPRSMRRPKARKRPARRTLRLQPQIESLEVRNLMSADLVGVARGADQWLLNLDNDPSQEIDFRYGLAGDTYVVGNWDGSGDRAGVVRAGGSFGLARWLLDTNGDPVHELDISYGFLSDIPVVGDWDGNGTDNIGVVRGGLPDGLLHWYLDTDTDPTHEIEIVFGLPGDVPVVGDWDGNGTANVGVVRNHPDGLRRWYLDTDTDPTHEIEIVFGLPGDVPVVGDWDGNGTANVGVVRNHPDGLLRWYLDTDTDPTHEIEYAYGFPGDRPVVGTWSFPEVTLTGVAAGQSLDFGSATLGAAAPSRTFTVRNDGNRDLYVGPLSVPAGFSAVRTGGEWLAPGAQVSVTLTMSTAGTGARSGQVVFATNDGNESPIRITVAGQVTPPPAPEIQVDGLQDGQVQAVDLGTVPQGAPKTQTFTVRNVGSAALTLAMPQLPAGFRLAEGLTTSLAPGQADSFTVELTAAAPATFSGQVVFGNNDADENPFNFPIIGRVQAPPATAPEIAIDGLTDGQGTVIDFGRVFQGAVTPTRTFLVRNLGNATLTLGSPALPVGFRLVQSLPAALAPGATASLVVALDTSSIAVRSGRISIANNDANENPFDFPVRGEVVAAPTPTAPEIAIVINGQSLVGTTGDLNFGPVVRGAGSNARTITIRNQGNADLTLANMVVSTGFTFTGFPARLAPGQSATVTVRLSETTLGARYGQVTFTSNDSDERSFLIRLSGKVYDPPTYVGGNPARPQQGVYTIFPSTSTTRVVIDPANGSVPFGTGYVISQIAADGRLLSRVTVDTSLVRLIIRTTRSIVVENWTNVLVTIQ